MVMFDTIWNFVVEQLQHNQFFSGAALAGAFTGVLYKLRDIPLKIYNRIHRWFFFSLEIDADVYAVPVRPYSAVNEWITTNHADKIRSTEISNYGSEGSAQLNDYFYFWYGGRYIKLWSSKKERESLSGDVSPFFRKHIISGWLAKKQILKLIDEIVETADEEYRKKVATKRNIKVWIARSTFDSTWGNNGDELTNKTFDELFFDQKEELLADLKSYEENASIYNRLRIPRKRGYLLHGVPGNGKSSIAYAIAEKLNYDIYILSLNCGEDLFLNRVSRISPNSVIAIEDIDTFYNGREGVGKNEISFSVFLNALSGIAAKEGIITVITTNNMEAIDPALLRSGRCDKVIELKNPSVDITREYLEFVYEQPIELNEMPDICFAELQNLVLQNIHEPNNLINELGTKII